MEQEDKYQHPDFRGRTKTGRKRPVFAYENPLAAERDAKIRKAGAEYRIAKAAAKTKAGKNTAYMHYKWARDKAIGEYLRAKDAFLKRAVERLTTGRK